MATPGSARPRRRTAVENHPVEVVEIGRRRSFPDTTTAQVRVAGVVRDVVRGVQLACGMTRASALVLAAVLASSGCTMSASSRRTVTLAGVATSLGGVLVMRAGANDSDGNGVNDTVLNDDFRKYYAGSLMFVVGIAAVLGALTSREPSEPAPVLAYVPPPPLPDTTFAQPPDAAPAAPEAPIVTVERVPVVPLPELPATAAVLRLAKQVRSASTHGRCDAAWIMWLDLERLDAGYARALRDGPVMTRCAP